MDNIMDRDEILTWVEQQEVVSTAGGAGKMDGGERWEPNQEGRTPTLKSSTLKPTQEVIEPGRNPDEEAITPTHMAPC